METAIKDATSKAESNTKSMMDSIKSARDTIDDIAESVDNFQVLEIELLLCLYNFL
jgi:flavin-binding protein dodecin